MRFIPPEFRTLGALFRLQRRVGIHPLYLAPPIVLSLITASLEGMGMGLLIPMLNGFLTRDFSFLKQTTGMSTVLSFLPASITTSDKSLFILLLTVFLLVILFKNIFRYISTVSMFYVVMRTIHHLRKILFSRYLHFGKLFFDRSGIGQHSAVFGEFLATSMRPLSTIDGFVNSMLSLGISIGVMFMISWKLTLISVPLFIVLNILLRHIIRRMQLLSSSISKSSIALNQKTIEILSTIPLVKSYNTELQEQKSFTNLSEQKTQLDFRMTVVEQLVRPMQELTTLLAMLILFTVMVYLLVQENTTAAPSFIVYFYLVYNSATKFAAFTGFRTALASASGPLHQVLLIMDDEGKYYVSEGKRTFEALRTSIELRKLSFSYPDNRSVFQDLSFSIQKGKLTAIVGPTGTGKTTIVNLLLRFYDCPKGTIFLDGTDIHEFTSSSLRKHMALVSQETLLLHDTLRHNIMYGVENASEKEVEEAVRRARLQDFIASLPEGLDTVIGDRGVKLSGGEKQRVSIARALLKKPDILILDEATSALDSKTEKLIQDAIDDAAKGKTALVIAHRLSTIQHADCIVVIEDGRCIEQGTLQELLDKNGRFAEYWKQQKFF
jgi:subfamily B ATP-binding cassette protein MsbA